MALDQQKRIYLAELLGLKICSVAAVHAQAMLVFAVVKSGADLDGSL
jgi:hypothetical protein